MPPETKNPLTHLKPAASAVPTCGQCGYCVRGISGLTCPECGSDLREVGILPPNYRRRAGPRTRMVFWTILLSVIAFFVSVLLLYTVLPFSQTLKVQRTFFLQAPAYLSTTVTLISSGRLPQPVVMGPGNLLPENALLFYPANNELLQINLKSGAYHYEYWKQGNRIAISKPSGFNGAVVADWFATGGTNANDPRVRSLCDQLAQAVNEVGNGTGNKWTPFHDAAGTPIGNAPPAFSLIVHTEPSPILIVILSLFWLTIWIIGLRRIHRGHSSPGGKPGGGRTTDASAMQH